MRWVAGTKVKQTACRTQTRITVTNLRSDASGEVYCSKRFQVGSLDRTAGASCVTFDFRSGSSTTSGLVLRETGALLALISTGSTTGAGSGTSITGSSFAGGSTGSCSTTGCEGSTTGCGTFGGSSCCLRRCSIMRRLNSSSVSFFMCLSCFVSLVSTFNRWWISPRSPDGGLKKKEIKVY